MEASRERLGGGREDRRKDRLHVHGPYRLLSNEVIAGPRRRRVVDARGRGRRPPVPESHAHSDTYRCWIYQAPSCPYVRPRWRVSARCWKWMRIAQTVGSLKKRVWRLAGWRVS